MIDTGLAGKVVLITGANRGIGAATARAFAAQQAAVFFTSLGEPTAAIVSKQIEQMGGRVASSEADLRDPAIIPQLFDRAEHIFGPVQILVNNAAASDNDTFRPLEPNAHDRIDRPLYTITSDSHDLHFAVNSRAVALLMAEFARRHIARNAEWGRIINLSTDGAHCFPQEVSYGASKAALEAYSRSAAAELGRYGIGVNIVSPGPTQTGWITPAFETQLVQSIPFGRVGQPEDIADAIVFLASQQANWITGQLIRVNGGALI